MAPTAEFMVITPVIVLAPGEKFGTVVDGKATLAVVDAVVVEEEEANDEIVIRRRVALRNGRCVVNNS